MGGCVFVGEMFLLRFRNKAKMTIFFFYSLNWQVYSKMRVLSIFFALSPNRKVPKHDLAGFKSSHVVLLSPKYISSKDTSSNRKRDIFEKPPIL